MTPIFLLFALTSLCSCDRPAQRDELIDRYRTAACIPVTLRDSPPTRTWDFKTTMEDGTVVWITGVRAPGGRVLAQFGAARDHTEVANAGDYMYPADVRVDRKNQRLFVKASGLPAIGSKAETWLFEYDLRQRREVRRLAVSESAMPSECKPA
jgi:hypothetical protein